MREFTKHVVLALKEDDWIVKANAIRHVKSFLTIDTDDMQPRDVPFKFTWLERKIVGHYVKKLKDRMLVSKLVESRLNPRKMGSYSQENTFLP